MTEKVLSAEELYKSGKMPDMMQHWYSIRRKYPDNFLIAYRMGDFYEFFYNDAVNVSRLLGLTLTKRGSGPSRHPLAGIPHKATQHFKNLVKQGQTVVIVEQLEDPKKATGKIVKRGVVRILSPGTVVDHNLLDSDSANYLCAIFRKKRNFGVAMLDLSSGDFLTTEFFGKSASRIMWAWINRFSPVECVLSGELISDFKFMDAYRENTSMILKEHSHYDFLFDNAYKTLTSQFHVENLSAFDLEDRELAISACGGLLAFIKETQKEESIDNVRRIHFHHDDNYMFLDVNTQKNLDLLKNQVDGGTYGTLFSVLHETKSPMGTRLLRQWIVQPLVIPAQIEERLGLVAFFIDHYDLFQEFRSLLQEVGDISRLISRINYSSTVNARNLLNLRNGLQVIHEIQRIFASTDYPPLQTLISELNDFSEIIATIDTSIHENPPTTITEGNIIKTGFHPQVDEYRDILQNGKQWVLNFEDREKKKLDVSAGLKVGYNRVLGYFIQITNNALKGLELPDEYTQRQTLKSAVRFDTPALKEMETKILSAEENVMDLEYELFQEIREKVIAYTLEIQQNAEIIAKLDVLSTFAEVALNLNYVRPKVSDSDKILIKQGRHPVIEYVNQKEPFIPNDCLLNSDSEQILIITGPNWSGKSTYLRQTALITLLAQIGSYVPAESAEIGIVDRIFTRIGASDDITRGQSTFMLEMNEMAQILNYATEKSMIIIDELGRGTGTVDGESIAQAVLEYLHESRIKTLFSTHFHQLINLKMERIHNYHFRIIEKPESRELVFLRQITQGGTDKSYGIHVGMMAGLPEKVTDRAFELMEKTLKQEETMALSQTQNNPNFSSVPDDTHGSLEEFLPSKATSRRKSPSKSNTSRVQKGVQTSLFPIKKVEDSELVILLRSLDLNHMTPIEAFETLVKLKKKLASMEK